MKYALLFVLFFVLRSARAQLFDYSRYPVYSGKDLGLSYSEQQSVFRIWSPTASQVQLIVYEQGAGGLPLAVHEMKKAGAGTWTALLKGDHKGKFYAFRVFIDGKWLDEVPDPYAKVVGVNGKRGMIANPSKVNPEGWDKDISPAFKNKTDAVIYELHIRDASIHLNSGIQNKGKFIGLT